MKFNPLARAALSAALLIAACVPAHAAETIAAVAANFAPAIARIEPAFEQATGHDLTVVFGSSGKLAQQIEHGAPFDVLLSADALRPQVLAKSGAGVASSRFTYAIGRLALWSADPAAIGADGPAYLRTGAFRHLAMANPAVAPYGVAAQQALEALGLWSGVQDRLVRGEDIGQVYAMVASGAAQAGFVALSSVLAGERPGSRWDVDPALHDPLRQDAILTARARDNPAARAFLDFLRSPRAHAIIESAGYGLP
jgi:molybdate transport system substrate-binding protein